MSGIGPAAELEGLDIEVKLDRPAVGTNLQDRYEVGIVSELSDDFNAVEDCTFNQSQPDPCLEKWKQGKGPYTTHGAAVSVVMRSSPDVPDPDLIVFGLPGYFKGYYPNYSKDVFGARNQFTWAVLKGHTGNSAGTVTLRTTDPRDVPDIRFRYFHEGTQSAAQSDLDAMVTGVNFIRRIGQKADDLLIFTGIEEVMPGPSVTDIAGFVRDEAWGHHASCTCPIGRDGDTETAVLDSKFRVQGTSNLRVVDASVFPKIPGFFIVVPIYMISEKAADEILKAAV
jgi:choline dehydrogenase